jgi:hypothetical protein
MTTYNEIRKITGNNKAYAAAALETLKATCWWVTGDESEAIVYLRTRDNDWVAIPDVYADEGAEFTTVRGASVILADDGSNYMAIEAE